jgi:outer membrane lipoprotein-sorting protein
MKFIYLFLILFLLVLSQKIFPQSLDAILENHFKVIGQEHLLDVETIVTKGRLRQGGVEIPINTYNKRPDKFRLEGKLQDLVYVEVFDGEYGWLYNPVQNEGQLQALSNDDLETLRDRADIDGLLFSYSEKGYNIELLNPVYVGKILTDVIRLTKQNGSSIIYFIDSETDIIIRTKTRMNVSGTPREYETVYSDYRFVSNILFPFAMDIFSTGELIMEYDFTLIELNVEIDDKLFITPQSLREQSDTF